MWARAPSSLEDLEARRVADREVAAVDLPPADAVWLAAVTNARARSEYEAKRFLVAMCVMHGDDREPIGMVMVDAMTRTVLMDLSDAIEQAMAMCDPPAEAWSDDDLAEFQELIKKNTLAMGAEATSKRFDLQTLRSYLQCTAVHLTISETSNSYSGSVSNSGSTTSDESTVAA